MVDMQSDMVVLVEMWKAKPQERSQNVSVSAQVEILRAELG